MHKTIFLSSHFPTRGQHAKPIFASLHAVEVIHALKTSSQNRGKIDTVVHQKAPSSAVVLEPSLSMIREALPTHEVHASRKVDQNLGPSFLHLSTISVYLHVRRFSRPSTHLISWNPRIEGMAFVIQVFTTTKSFFRPAVTITSDTTTHHYLQDYTFPDSLIPYLSSYLYARLVLTIDYYLPSFSGSFPPLCATRILSRSLHVFESFSFSFCVGVV